jgi:outer membrane receptor protein involved in Fe transport
MQFLNVGPGYAYTVRGNPELEPETAFNLTAGVEWSDGPAYLRGQVFRNRFDDFIETRLAGDSSGVTVYTYGNIANGFTRGLELEAGWSARGLDAEASYAWLEARDEETDLPLLERPTHSGRVSVEYALPFGLRSAVTGVYTGAAPVQRTETGTIGRDAYLRWDVRLIQPIRSGLDLSLGGRNLGGAVPDNWPGFTGRHLYVTIGWAVSGARSQP